VEREREEDAGLEIVLSEDPRVVLYAERLRDGRVALGTRRRQGAGWEPGELHLLEPSAYLDLAAWLAPLVTSAWIDAIRDRQAEPLRTAGELFGTGSEGVARLAADMLEQIPRSLLVRAMILLANSIGPEARNRLVQQLNRTTNPSNDAMLRRRMADESEAFAYAVATAALFDALATGAGQEER
jgi:hypothetical protein